MNGIPLLSRWWYHPVFSGAKDSRLAATPTRGCYRLGAALRLYASVSSRLSIHTKLIWRFEQHNVLRTPIIISRMPGATSTGFLHADLLRVVCLCGDCLVEIPFRLPNHRRGHTSTHRDICRDSLKPTSEALCKSLAQITSSKHHSTVYEFAKRHLVLGLKRACDHHSTPCFRPFT
jgi:hypothetical protein